jgi:putative ABC transport system substrate-binding protein
MRRVGLVASEVPLADVFGPNPRWPHWAALVEELRALGWVEGQNIRFERRSDEGQPARRSEIFEELVQLQMDALVTVSNPMTVAARRATRTIPIVTVVMTFPVETGLVASLARPGGNVTGLSTGASRELNAKRLQLLKEAVPGLSRVAVLRGTPSTGTPLLSPEIEAAARALRLTLFAVTADRPDQLEAAVATAARSGASGLLVVDSIMNIAQHRALTALAARHRLPAVYGHRIFVESGGLMAYSPDLLVMFRRAATYVDKLLRGTQPGNLPVEEPTKFELLINLKTATMLGLTVPSSLMVQAAEIMR